MKKFYAPVSPDGYFDFNTINYYPAKIKLTASDIKYGGIKVKQINMFKFENEMPISLDLWERHKIAWIWLNPDNTYWWDTLSLSYEETKAWASRAESMIKLGFKVIPVQFKLHENLVTA